MPMLHPSEGKEDLLITGEEEERFAVSHYLLLRLSAKRDASVLFIYPISILAHVLLSACVPVGGRGMFSGRRLNLAFVILLVCLSVGHGV